MAVNDLRTSAPATSPATGGTGNTLDVKGLVVSLKNGPGELRIVDDVDLRVGAGKRLGLVGESGSGKSMTMLACLRLLPEPPASVEAERLHVAGGDFLNADRGTLRSYRGGQVGMIFQDPLTALNPVLTVGSQISEVFRYHSSLSRGERRDAVVELLRRVGIPGSQKRYKQYPHELSGGMRQRVGIAMAIANRPGLLIADEPTTALDVTVQAQILDLLSELTSDTGMSVVLITHDLGVIAETVDDVAVMYAGQIVETAPVVDIFDRPSHPYTLGLLASRPRGTTSSRLLAIPGQPPQPADRPAGCPFQPRCPLSKGREECRTIRPPLIGPSMHKVACHFAAEIEGSVR